MPQTLEKLQADREKAIEGNRALGVIPWGNRQEQAKDVVYEVLDGYHRVPSSPTDSPRGPEMLTLGPGNRFHPTVHQVQTNSLRGKVRELNRDEYASIGRSGDPSRSPKFAGADIGIRALPMSDAALKLALGVLSEEDFEGVTPEGSDGRYLVKQVEALIEAKTSAAN